MREAQIHNSRTSGRFRLFNVTVFAALLAWLSSAVSHAQGVPEGLQAAIFYKVLAYDYSIKEKPGSEVTIAVITDGKTADRAAALLAGFQKLVGKQLGGKAIRIISLKLTGPGQVGQAAQADILYLPEGVDEKIVSAVLALAESDKHAVLGGSEALAAEGCAIGLTVEAGKPKIVINHPASQAQGMNLSSKVLRLARVIQ